MMNDFTKEELEEIYELLTHGFGENHKCLTISHKLKSLIDNYCEHEPIWETPNHVICYCEICLKGIKND
jgi:hypothetical protein